MKGQKTEDRSQKSDQKKIKHKFFLSVFCLLCSVFCLLSSNAWAATIITADHLKYFEEKDKYILTGNVRIEREGTILNADKVIFFQATSDAEAMGSVVYEDAEALINAELAKVNLDDRTGRLYNAIIFFKRDNYWITGDDIQKIAEDHYYATTATFTTCDAMPSMPTDWCFRGNDVDLKVGERIIAKDVTFRIRNIPFLYSPYLWAPLLTERQTGFLIPTIGISTEKGFQFSPAFFWAIDYDKDATFYLDYYSKRGIGKGIEYRYIGFNNKGRWFAYYLKDRELKKDFYRFEGMHEHQIKNVRGFIDVNYVNEDDLYREFARERDLRIQRFLQSTGEVSVPLKNSRLYLLSQYWIDLQGEDDHVPQKLPELGYVINPIGIGPLIFTKLSSITNFYRDKGLKGQRLDISPTLSHSFGDGIQLLQTFSLSGTAYNLKNDTTYDSSSYIPLEKDFLTGYRLTFEYRANALTRFIRKYESFTHTVEPSLLYRFVPEARSLPPSGFTELFNEASLAQFSLLNTLSFKKLSLSTRLTQPYDFNANDNRLLPTRLDASLSGPFTLRLDVTYDLNKDLTETINSELRVNVTDKTSVRIGERYSRRGDILLLAVGVDSVLSKRWAINVDAWHDVREGNLRDAALKVIYTQQCWAVTASLTRKPGDNLRPPEHSFMVFIELRGLGAIGVPGIL